MEMREKLIDILRVPIYPHELADPAEVVADYLLDNGVIVMPCKLGETVYIIRDCSCYGRYWSGNTRGKCDGKVFLGKKRRAYHCGYVSEGKFDFKHFADFGKMVFLTREEAEAVLEKMRYVEADNA